MEELRHVFIVNPAAGKGNNERRVREAAQAYFSASGGSYDIRLTRAPMHAAEIAQEEAERGGPVRLYACGGDGTLGDVANGVAGRENVEVAMLPIGTGNDYVKTFGKVEDFQDIAKLATGRSVTVDLIRAGDRLAVGLCSMGFDAEVNSSISRFKKLPLVTGGLAYNMSVLYCLMKKMRTRFDIVIDGETRRSGDFLLCVVANAQWYGGGYHAAPAADPGDGILDFVVADKVGRIEFIKMVNKYRTGRHESLKVVKHLTGTRLAISSPSEFALNCDGECSYVKEIAFEVMPGAMKFIVPESCFMKGEMGNTYKHVETQKQI